MGLGRGYIGMGGSGDGVKMVSCLQSKEDTGRRKKTDEPTPDDKPKEDKKSTKDTEKESEKVPVDEPEKKESGESFVAPADEEGEVGAGEEEIKAFMYIKRSGGFCLVMCVLKKDVDYRGRCV